MQLAESFWIPTPEGDHDAIELAGYTQQACISSLVRRPGAVHPFLWLPSLIGAIVSIVLILLVPSSFPWIWLVLAATTFPVLFVHRHMQQALKLRHAKCLHAAREYTGKNMLIEVSPAMFELWFGVIRKFSPDCSPDNALFQMVLVAWNRGALDILAVISQQFRIVGDGDRSGIEQYAVNQFVLMIGDRIRSKGFIP